MTRGSALRRYAADFRRAPGVDVDRLSERLDRLSEALESSRPALKTADNLPTSQAIPIILARQSLLISAVFNLTEMMEELLAANGRPRRPAFDFVDEERQPPAFSAHDHEYQISTPEPVEAVIVPVRSGGFGTLARRRSATLGVLAAILIVAALIWISLAWGFPPGFG